MKTLNKNQWIAVVISLGLLAYLLFSGPIMNLFGLSNENTDAQTPPPPGLVTEDVVVGTGSEIAPGDILTVHYVGSLSNGRVFDSSRDRDTPFTFQLGVGQVIRGWDEGLIGMRVGGKRLLAIPPEYGYGDQSVGTIPANAVLIFEVELLNAEQPTPR